MLDKRYELLSSGGDECTKQNIKFNVIKIVKLMIIFSVGKLFKNFWKLF